MPVLAPMYIAVAASTPPSRNPVIAERNVSCGMSPRKTFLNHHSSFWARVQVRTCSSSSCSSAMRSVSSGWRYWAALASASFTLQRNDNELTFCFRQAATRPPPGCTPGHWA